MTVYKVVTRDGELWYKENGNWSNAILPATFN